MCAASPPAPAPLALTMGEPAGVAGEIAIKAWRRRADGVSPFFVIDDPGRLRTLARRIGLEVPVEAIERTEQVAEVFPRALPVLKLTLPAPVEPGRLDPANAPAVIAAIERAVALATSGAAAAVVTGPIHKRTLYESGFRHPGHTEYLAALAGGGAQPVMMLVGGGLRVVPITIHQPLAHAIATLSTEAIVSKGRIVARALARDFAIARPRLAVAALNPHAGEGGSLGREEIDVIAPAIAALARDGIDVSGPHPADTLFYHQARGRYDASLCMYHDQALIALKTLDFEHGVNVTLGLPFVRTSPDHGTALELAGTGRASEESLLAALRLARAIADCRARAREGVAA